MRLFPVLALIAASVPVGCFSPDEEDTGGSATADDTSGSGESTVSTTTPTGPDTTVSATDPEASATDPEASATDPEASATDPDTTGTDEAPPVDCEAPDGQPDAVCPESAPFCQGGTCVACDAIAEGACAALDPATPICTADGACAACTEHDQCGTGACRFATGECFPEANRLWVDNTAANCANGTGAEDNPFCQIVTAVEIIDEQVGTDPWAVFVAGSPNDYTGTIDVDSGRAVAIIGPAAGLAATLDGVATYALDLWAQSPEIYISHLTMTAGNSQVVRGGGDCEVWFTDTALSGGELGVETAACTVHTNRSVFEGFATYGMEVGANGSLDAIATDFRDGSGGLWIQGTARLDGSYVRDHYVGGGITIDGGHLELVNSFVTYNQYANDGIANNGGTFDIVYSTVIGAITCTNAGTSTIRNSIVLGHQFEAGQTCATAAVDYSVVNAGVEQGTGNVPATEADLASIFIDPSAQVGDYHVMPGSIPMDIAVWADGDPLVDFDGDARPGMVGEPDYAGADVP